MEKDINKISGKDLILWKMRNMLEGSARLCIENSTLTDKQTVQEMDRIEREDLGYR